MLSRLLAFVAGVGNHGDAGAPGRRAAWWLGRELGGRVGAFVASLFMAGCSTHVLVNSHVAWSHSTTPLWTTLGFACLLRALRVPTPTSPLYPSGQRETGREVMAAGAIGQVGAMNRAPTDGDGIGAR